MGRWEHFSHQADIGVRGHGATLEDALAAAAMALTAVVTEPAGVRSRETVHVECLGTDPDLLLYDFLNALVFEMATRHMLFSRFELRREGDRLLADVSGERVDPARHAPAVEVKGATLTELAVRREADGQWLAQCVLDV